MWHIIQRLPPCRSAVGLFLSRQTLFSLKARHRLNTGKGCNLASHDVESIDSRRQRHTSPGPRPSAWTISNYRAPLCQCLLLSAWLTNNITAQHRPLPADHVSKPSQVVRPLPRRIGTTAGAMILKQAIGCASRVFVVCEQAFHLSKFFLSCQHSPPPKFPAGRVPFSLCRR